MTKCIEGFDLFVNNKYYFVLTERKNKTENLAKEILDFMGFPDVDVNINIVLRCLKKAGLYITKENGIERCIFVSNGKPYKSIPGTDLRFIDLRDESRKRAGQKFFKEI